MFLTLYTLSKSPLIIECKPTDTVSQLRSLVAQRGHDYAKIRLMIYRGPYKVGNKLIDHCTSGYPLCTSDCGWLPGEFMQDKKLLGEYFTEEDIKENRVRLSCWLLK